MSVTSFSQSYIRSAPKAHTCVHTVFICAHVGKWEGLSGHFSKKGSPTQRRVSLLLADDQKPK